MGCIYSDTDGTCTIHTQGVDNPGCDENGYCICEDDPNPQESCDNYEPDSGDNLSKQKPMLTRNNMTGNIYIVTDYIDHGDGNIEPLLKIDVTEEFEEIGRKHFRLQ